MKTKEKGKDKYVIFGYVPLLQEPYLAETLTLENLKEKTKQFIGVFQKAVDEAPSPEFCAWFMEEGKLSPVFGVEKPQEVADHIKWYSEEKPEDWFFLVINKTEKHYDIALFPKFDKMKDRFSFNVFVTAQVIVKTTDHFDFLFKPLHFRSKNRGSIEGLSFPNKMKLGLVNPTKVDITKNQQEINPIIVGEFDVNPPGYEYALGYFKK